MPDTPEPAACDETPTQPPTTTAARLSAYYEELVAAGFSTSFASGVVNRAAPRDLADVELASDEKTPTLSMGPVRVYMMAKVDEESLAKAAEEIKWSLSGLISEDGAPADA